MDRKQIIHDLAKEYTFRKFDFSNGSPEELLSFYQENYAILNNVFLNQDKEIQDASVDRYLKSIKT